MLKKVWYQVHWFLGITAGLVLAVVGVSGAALSFQDELMRWLNPGVITVTPATSAALAPADLLARIRAAHPDGSIASLTLSGEADTAARVGFAPAPGQRRGEMRYVDPYSGVLLGQPRGGDFFQFMRALHRTLVADDIGKQVVGASTVALIILSLSGLYLRWPRAIRNWRVWLTFNPALKGRSFLRALHLVAGTWMLIPYLIMGLTGLYWSYDWYRDGLYALSGAPRPTRPSEANGAAKAAPRIDPDIAPDINANINANINAAWTTFRATVPTYASATLRLPERAGQPLRISYLATDAAHDRAVDTIVIDPTGGRITKQERYVDKPAGARFMSSIFPLHSGAWFGVAGVVVWMLSSLMMLLFTVTGLMLYLDRRGKTRLRDRKRASAAAGPLGDTTA